MNVKKFDPIKQSATQWIGAFHSQFIKKHKQVNDLIFEAVYSRLESACHAWYFKFLIDNNQLEWDAFKTSFIDSFDTMYMDKVFLCSTAYNQNTDKTLKEFAEKQFENLEALFPGLCNQFKNVILFASLPRSAVKRLIPFKNEDKTEIINYCNLLDGLPKAT